MKLGVWERDGPPIRLNKGRDVCTTVGRGRAPYKGCGFEITLWW